MLIALYFVAQEVVKSVQKKFTRNQIYFQLVSKIRKEGLFCSEFIILYSMYCNEAFHVLNNWHHLQKIDGFFKAH